MRFKSFWLKGLYWSLWPCGTGERMLTRPIKGICAEATFAAMEGEADVSPASLHFSEGQGSHIAPVLEGLKQGCPGCGLWEGGGQIHDTEGQVLLSPAA